MLAAKTSNLFMENPLRSPCFYSNPNFQQIHCSSVHQQPTNRQNQSPWSPHHKPPLKSKLPKISHITANLSELTSLPANPLTKLYQRPIKETIQPAAWIITKSNPNIHQTHSNPFHQQTKPIAVNPITNHHSKPKKKKTATQPVKTQSNQTAISATTGEPNQPQPWVDPQSASLHQRPKSTTSSFLTPMSHCPRSSRADAKYCNTRSINVPRDSHQHNKDHTSSTLRDATRLSPSLSQCRVTIDNSNLFLSDSPSHDIIQKNVFFRSPESGGEQALGFPWEGCWKKEKVVVVRGEEMTLTWLIWCP